MYDSYDETSLSQKGLDISDLHFLSDTTAVALYQKTFT